MEEHRDKTVEGLLTWAGNTLRDRPRVGWPLRAFVRTCQGQGRRGACGGHALHVQGADYSLCYEKVNEQGFDSVHAFRAHALRNDVIVVYDDAAMCLRYLVQVL